MGKRLAKKVLVIGWDAADWNVINPLIEKGFMPTLEKFINQGVMGKISTLDPPLSPMLWTSIGTGKTAEKHGILGFTEPNSTTQSIRPVSVTSRKVKALWNILTHEKYKTHLVGWWPSHPAEPINGIVVSDMFTKMDKSEEGCPFKYQEDCIHPKELEDLFVNLRVHPSEIASNHITPFIPNAEKVDQEKHQWIQTISILLSQCATNHNAATWILENKEWDFLGVYFDTIDHFCHAFMKYHPPKMDGIEQEEFDFVNDVVNSAYRYHDMMLERYLKLAGDDATIIIVSDHGFHSGSLRPKTLPKDPASPAFEHSQYGIIAMKGPGILKDELIYGASVLDITPTILTLFGLPVGKDMDGKVLVNAFDENVIPEFIDSWEDLEGDFGMHPPEMRDNPWSSQDAMNQLVELGYVEAPSEDNKVTLKRVVDESNYYLALTYSFKKQYSDALPLLEKLVVDNPDTVRFLMRLASCYQSLGNNIGCRKVIEKLRTLDSKTIPHLDFLEGSLLLSENKVRNALEKFKSAEKAVPHFPNLHLQIANTYFKIKKLDLALGAYNKAFEIDPDNPTVHHGIGVCYLRLDRYEEAIDELLTAVGFIHLFPAAHYHLGEALLKNGNYEMAEQAFLVSLAQSPGNRRAHQWIAKLYKEHLVTPEKAIYHEEFIKNNIKGTITIVSGLPRSGTSMMMQMLNAAGLDVLTDNVRQNDDSNPKGYLELEKVKKLHLDNSWLKEADGKLIKVVAPLVMNLSNDYNYKIIFMLRDMDEMIRSQQKMLGKSEDVIKSSYPVSLIEAFKKQLEKADIWLKSMPNVSYMYVNYTDVINSPEEQIENLNSFFDNELDTDKMLGQVDPSLYRNKSKEFQN